MSYRENPNLATVAEQYRLDGYEVTIHPKRDQLPKFMAGFQPDILARKAGENVVIEVASRQYIAKELHRLEYWLGKINSEPGWRFDLVVTGTSQWPDQVTKDASDPEIEDVRERNRSARRSLEQGFLEPAFLFAWSLSEAAMRIVASSLLVQLKTNRPADVMKQLYMVGILSNEELDRLQHLMTIRNSVAHGLKTSDLDESAVTYVMAVTERLLSIAEGAKPKLAGV